MSDVELIGTMHDTLGHGIAFGVESDEIRITVSPVTLTILLAPQQQDEFARLYQQAERRAEAHSSRQTAGPTQGERMSEYTPEHAETDTDVPEVETVAVGGVAVPDSETTLPTPDTDPTLTGTPARNIPDTEANTPDTQNGPVNFPAVGDTSEEDDLDEDEGVSAPGIEDYEDDDTPQRAYPSHADVDQADVDHEF